MSVTRDFKVELHTGSSMSGCLGSVTYYDATEENGNGYYGVPVEKMIEEGALGTGSIIRVTVEVVKAEPLPTTCQNPWSGHWDRFKREGGGVLNNSCICDGEAPASEHRERAQALRALSKVAGR